MWAILFAWEHWLDEVLTAGNFWELLRKWIGYLSFTCSFIVGNNILFLRERGGGKTCPLLVSAFRESIFSDAGKEYSLIYLHYRRKLCQIWESYHHTYEFWEWNGRTVQWVDFSRFPRIVLSTSINDLMELKIYRWIKETNTYCSFSQQISINKTRKCRHMITGLFNNLPQRESWKG
jgi:hypothetical protein